MSIGWTPMPEQPLGEARLAEIEARAEAAPSAPWEIGDGYGGSDGIGIYGVGMEIANVQETTPEVADFVAHAREDIPALVAEVRRLRYFLETVTVVCQNCGNQGRIKVSEPFVCLCGAPLREPEPARTY
jgi:hypothetical protein